MKQVFILLFMTLTLTAHGQMKNFKIGIELNQPVIPSVSHHSEMSSPPPYLGYYSFTIDVASIQEKFHEKPGVSIHGSFDIALSSKVYFQSGLRLSYLRFTRDISVKLSDYIEIAAYMPPTVVRQGAPFGSFYGSGIPAGIRPINNPEHEKIGKTNSVYLQVPFLLGTSILKNKLSLNAGGVASMMVYASSYSYDLTSVKKYTATNDFTTILMGAMVQVSYNVTPKFSIDLDGQHFFNSLYKSEAQSGGTAKMNVLSVGASYRL